MHYAYLIVDFTDAEYTISEIIRWSCGAILSKSRFSRLMHCSMPGINKHANSTVWSEWVYAHYIFRTNRQPVTIASTRDRRLTRVYTIRLRIRYVYLWRRLCLRSLFSTNNNHTIDSSSLARMQFSALGKGFISKTALSSRNKLLIFFIMIKIRKGDASSVDKNMRLLYKRS